MEMSLNNRFIKKTSLMIRKHLFENKPYEDFDKCYLCNSPITYRNSKIVLINDDMLPACACRHCLKEMHEIKTLIEKHLSTKEFRNFKEYVDEMNRHIDFWVDIKKGKI